MRPPRPRPSPDAARPRRSDNPAARRRPRPLRRRRPLAGAVATASCRAGSNGSPIGSRRRIPRLSSTLTNCCWTIDTPWTNGSSGRSLAAASARSRLSSTSRNDTSIERRPRSTSLLTSLRSLARACSNSSAALAVLGEESLQLRVLGREPFLELLDVRRLEPRLLGPPARRRRAPTSAGRSPSAQTCAPNSIRDLGFLDALLVSRLVGERQLVVRDADHHGPAMFELAEEHLVGERIADLALHDARERPRAEYGS